jgi:hypothetical protein
MKPLRNEVQRLVVNQILMLRGPEDYQSQHSVWAYREEGRPWATICDKLHQDYTQIASICSHRAIDAEVGELVCAGARVKAEEYLALWRTTALKPITNAELNARGGYILATIKKQTQRFDQHAQKSEPAIRDLLGRSDCRIEGPTITWSIQLRSSTDLHAYEALTSMWLKQEDQPGEDSLCISFHLPEPSVVPTAVESDTLISERSMAPQLELEM